MTTMARRAVAQVLQPAAIQFAAYVFICVACFSAAKIVFWRTAGEQPSMEPLIWICAVALPLATWHVRMKDLPTVMAVILKFMFVMFGLYMAFPATLPADVDLGSLSYIRMMQGHWIWPILCILGFWRPGFGVVALMASIWQRQTFSELLGAELSHTEYFPLVEIAAFMLISTALLPVIRRIGWLSAFEEPLSESDTLTTLEKVALCGVAVHLSNYFYSGMKKAVLGDNPFSWVLHNDTWNLILSSNAMGQFPLSFNHTLAGFSVEVFQHTLVIGNAVIFLAQLLAIVAATRINWTRWAAAFYDVTHTFIFLVSGIFFYKWIVLNLAIVAGLRSIRHKVVPPALALILMGIVGLAPTVFFVAQLGWWDTRSFDHEQFYAITTDGRELEVPINYWGGFSIEYGQSRRIRDKSDGFFPTGSYANIFGQRNMEKANDCGFELPPASVPDVVTKTFADPDNAVARNVRLVHRYVMEHIDAQGHLYYDFYPHHIWSMPWEFTEFMALDKRTIKAYRYVVEAVCLGYKNGEFTEDVRRRSDHVIPVE